MGAPFDATSLPDAPVERICPHCGSADIRGLGRLFATSAGLIRMEYRCQACATAFWLFPDRRLGPRDRRAPERTGP